MLELTQATTFEAGTNLKGTVAGANWLFLLPSLELGRVVCLGMPAPSALHMVSRFARDVVVICESEQQRCALAKVVGNGDGDRIDLISSDRQDKLDHEDSTVGLAWIANRGGLDQLTEREWLLPELWRTLAPDSLIFVDPGKSVSRTRALDDVAACFGVPQRLWLTPTFGEMQTAVPADDETTIARFLKEGLHSYSLGYGALRILKHFSRKQRAAQNANEALDSREPSKGNRSRAPIRSMLRRSGRSAMRSIQSVERYLVTFSARLRRYGALITVDGAELLVRPPKYLQSIASEAGFDIDDYRWGLSARGAYNTRKVLIFLYGPETVDARKRPPNLVVKIVRDPALNYRLENEFRALREISETAFAEREIAPWAAFLGVHRGLALVGETMIQGRSFLQRTDATAGCRYARSAVDWIINLGADTADPSLASPEQVTGVMDKLLDRFNKIYQLSGPHRKFLARQIAAIGESRDSFPLVFQHGDPGTWNALVTPEDRVTFLDWEAAEPEGMPLWDLFYFQRSFCMVNARKNGVHERQAAITRGFLEPTSFNRQLIESTKRYCEEIGVATSLVEPLFFTCWMHRALKEATSLSPSKVDDGNYVSLLRYFIENSHTTALVQLFSSGVEPATSGHSASPDKEVALT